MIDFNWIPEKSQGNSCCNCKNIAIKIMEIGNYKIPLCDNCYKELLIEFMKDDGCYYRD